VLYVAETNGGLISDSVTASFVFSENPFDSDTDRLFAYS